ncbi:GNAT family N-acetyltransferase [Lactobacillus sp. ESL0791]|uniref:GNAT family N-acetyltransferase n=1 Tax=Lactobacillus sp. ESL0791 TaxID=2983234 RepID=UPI0023F8FC41|nr:GNAT family N-acetyltransferase [Lactobacillus sp. ESL0791]MDF7638103.1 GNAT family N-acetyltransferase [Lactobacillus sp. ESL0791]
MIRTATIADCPAIQKINQEELSYDYPVDKTEGSLKQILNASTHYLLVYVNDQTSQVEGYVHAELFLETYFSPMFDILALAVAKDAQQKGIGSQLMTQIEEKAKSLGVDSVRLNSGEERTGAHRFYEKIGYTCTKKQKRFFKKLR